MKVPSDERWAAGVNLDTGEALCECGGIARHLGEDSQMREWWECLSEDCKHQFTVSLPMWARL